MFDANEFENDVRRVARLRWPDAGYAGAELIDGRERDGVYITEDCVHLLECTTSRTLAKARDDLKSRDGVHCRFRGRPKSAGCKAPAARLQLQPEVLGDNCLPPVRP